MDEQLRIILIIIVSASIFGLLVFVFVKNYIRNKINNLVDEEIPMQLLESMKEFITNKYVFLLFLNIFLLSL